MERRSGFNMLSIRRTLSYNDVLLAPRNSELDHVSEADILYNYNKIALSFKSVPLINAAMDTICTPELMRCLHGFNMPLSIHRWFDTVEEQIEFYKKCNLSKSDRNVFIAVGTYAKWGRWIDTLIKYREKSGKNFGLLVDVSNGDTKSCEATVRYIRNSNQDMNIMAGNVSKKQGFERLQDAGANFVKVGIGGGSICQTRTSTGFGIPTLTSVLDCADIKDSAFLVADGGVEFYGDICKAIVAGADLVMAGKLFAGTDLSAGEKYNKNFEIETDPENYKWVRYSGMASKEAISKLKSKKSVISVEGISGVVPHVGKTEEVVQEIQGCLQTAMSYYAGCKDWISFRNHVKFVEITAQGWGESITRVKI